MLLLNEEPYYCCCFFGCVFVVFFGFFLNFGVDCVCSVHSQYAKAQVKNGERKQREVNRFSALPLCHIYQEE